MYRGIKMKEQLEKIYSDAVADIEKAATVKIWKISNSNI